jgi:hypothetical protein
MERPFRFHYFKSLAIAQRLLCSSVALAATEENYRAGTTNWMKLQKFLPLPEDSSAGQNQSVSESQNEVQTISGLTFRDGWAVKHRLQAGNVDALVNSIGTPELRRLGRIEKLHDDDVHPSDFLLRLPLSALALEDWSSHRRDNTNTPALAVLNSCRKAWEPDDACFIQVPAFRQPGLPELARAAAEQHGAPIDPKAVAARARQESAKLRTTTSVRALYAQQDLRFWPVFMARVLHSSDYKLGPTGLRWAMDLVSSAIASQALIIRDIKSKSFSRDYRKLARFNYAVAEYFLRSGPITSLSTVARLVRHTPQSNPTLTASAWTTARTAFQSELLALGLCPDSLWHVWDAAHACLDSSSRVRAGAPGRFRPLAVSGSLETSPIESAMRRQTFNPSLMTEWFFGKLTPRLIAKLVTYDGPGLGHFKDSLTRFLQAQEMTFAARRDENTPARSVPDIDRRNCPLGQSNCLCRRKHLEDDAPRRYSPNR